ncbi:HSPB1-associated protein 1 homolog isoform X2 [Carcharodon carcharias]|uniref:HSPB1-associated protein 1 homolog isoform X2 n=1 Tax=Carcharodon carcharias TaxID=13397 RepID=UPI001B7E8DC8|nr:HSPB1-associated protein 1 homolog isoform X2 [Carcharodon carcharias]
MRSLLTATDHPSVAKEGLDIRASELEGREVIMSQASKPFNPEEVRVIVASLQQPAVFLNMVSDWPALKWNVEYLSHVLNGKPLKFRIGERNMTKVPQFETHCEYVQATLQEFLVWLHGGSDVSAGLFAAFPRSRYWAYADYKYIAMTFEEKAEVFQDIIWSDFGFPGRDGRDSTLWIGSEAANTPCHLDSYGCNLVLQVQGRKRWHLFPPEDTSFLYPSRIPYEESSIFSSVNVVNPDLERFPRFRGARPHVVTLHPGEVLFVPKHWWHYVESLDPVTVSINSWIELDDDDEARVGEALTRTVVCALKSVDPRADIASWLNTTEAAVTSHETNLHYVNLAVQACLDKPKICSAKGRNTSARGSSAFSRKRKCGSGEEAEHSAATDAVRNPAEPISTLTPSIPFGPNLVSVAREAAAVAQHGVPSVPRDDNISLTNNLEANYCCGRKDCNSKPTGVHRAVISTDELLNCLVHPDVISLMTEILLDRHCSH